MSKPIDHYECDGCGACCCLLHDLRLAQDAAREPRILAETQELGGWLETPRWAYRLHPLPFHEACCFLDPDKRCTIYETRPDVCREFAAGDEPCQTARAAKGLPPLAPVHLSPAHRSMIALPIAGRGLEVGCSERVVPLADDVYRGVRNPHQPISAGHARWSSRIFSGSHGKERVMLHRVMGALALLGGALLAGSLLAQVPAGSRAISTPSTSLHGPAAAPRTLLEALDRNLDGTLSPEEITLASSSLERLDTNRSGTVTPDELNNPAAIPPRRQAARSEARPSPPRVQPPCARDDAEAKILSVLDVLDHHRQGTMNVPREDGRMLRLLAEAVGAKNSRRARHLQRLLGPLVQPGPGQDRRPPHHVRHRPGPVRAGEGQLQEGRRRRHDHPGPRRRPRGSRSAQGPDRHPLHRRRQDGLSRLPHEARCPWSAPAA